MVFLPRDAVMSAEEAANVIKVDETDHFNEEWTPPFDFRDSVLLKTNEKFTDSYDLFESLGEGKFGKVYRCLEKSTKLELAAKCIRLKRDADKKQVEKEISFMTRMRHRCIAQMYDAFATSQNEVVLIMEIVHGGELFDRVVEENYILTETAVAMIVYQICEAIGYIHSQNIIHLDLKPENIMCVSQTGNQIKLIDFGLAQYYDGEHDLLFMAGTPEFAAPEVIKFEPLDFHTDMWSVGVIVYILLSGESPFLGDNLALTYYNVERGLWEFCEEFDDNGVTSEARTFIESLLILDKSKRMLPGDCLKHPWIQMHLEKARQHREDQTQINTAKLRNYVRNKNFRRLVFGVLFVNTVVRIFNTLREKNCESGIQYVKNMLDAVNSKETDNSTGERESLMKTAITMGRRTTSSTKKESTETPPLPSPPLLTTDDTNMTQEKMERLDSGLGEGSTKLFVLDELEEEANATLSSEKFEYAGPPTQESPSAAPPVTPPKKPKIKKKIVKASPKTSNDSALAIPAVIPEVPLPTSSDVPLPAILDSKDSAALVEPTPAPAPVIAPVVLSVPVSATTLSDGTSTTATVTTTTTATTASEDETAPKVKKVIRRKKVPKPVLTLRDVEVPTVKYPKKKVKKAEKTESSHGSLKAETSSTNVSFKKSESQTSMENAETQPIESIIARRRPEGRRGMVGNLLKKLEQNIDKSTVPKFAVSGVVPIKPPATLKHPTSQPVLWASASSTNEAGSDKPSPQKLLTKVQSHDVKKSHSLSLTSSSSMATSSKQALNNGKMTSRNASKGRPNSHSSECTEKAHEKLADNNTASDAFITKNTERPKKQLTNEKMTNATKIPQNNGVISIPQTNKFDAKTKNRSLDNLLDDATEPGLLSKKNVTFSDQLLDADEPLEMPSTLLIHTQSTYTISSSPHDDDRYRKSSTASLPAKPERRKLNELEIMELQAQERDSFDFKNLRAQLERRVSTTPQDELQEWKQNKQREVRVMLHDSSNVKRAMNKWLSMDKAKR